MGKYPEAQAKMVLALQLQRTAPDATLFKHAAAIEKALGNEDKAQEYREKVNELEGK
jgi:Tfp pilus assembly protein PilF